MIIFLLLLFFLSGTSALLYQVAWVRVVGPVFGVTVYAIGTVLAAFMAGLALGSYVSGRLADRSSSPLRVYGLVEMGIGTTALLTLPAFTALPEVYRGLYDLLLGHPWAVAALRALLAFVILVVPTSLMGATLPIMVRSSLLRAGPLSRHIALFYAVNTAGAVAGTLASGFFLIGTVGVTTTIVLAAGLNLLLGVSALATSFLTAAAVRTETITATPGETEAKPTHGRDTAVLAVYGLSGFCALAYEVAWTRALVMFFDNSIYAFAIMLATVLAGIALGSYAVTPFLQRRANWLFVFATLELGVGAAALLSVLFLSRMRGIVAQLAQISAGWLDFQTTDLFLATVSFLTIFPTTFLLGVLFPVVARVHAPQAAAVARRLGQLYAANVTGAIFGSLAASFVLVPTLGSQSTLQALAAANLGLGVALLALARPASRPLRTGLALAAGGGLALFLLSVPDMYQLILIGRFPGYDILWYQESVESTVTVVREPAGAKILYVNARGQASTQPELVRFHRQMAHLPVLLHADPRRALVVGLGGGATAGAIALHEGVNVDVVELSPGVPRAAAFLAEVNDGVLERPNVRLRVDDGRNYLLLTANRYDIITGDVFLPFDAGSAYIYAAEYFRLARQSLTDDGVVAQWLPPFNDTVYRLVLRTFLSNFPHVTLWLNGDLLIGSNRPLRVDPAVLAQRVRQPALREVLPTLGLDTSDTILRQFNASTAELWEYAGDGLVISDDRPLIEYYRGLQMDSRPPDLSRYRRDLTQVLK
ncbi:MAG: fused MFS/spermidine synthase [Chloroflexi bacterium]|nr:fused MFS/spermidine synthase [Chloroflexota bacterium]